MMHLSRIGYISCHQCRRILLPSTRSSLRNSPAIILRVPKTVTISLQYSKLTENKVSNHDTLKTTTVFPTVEDISSVNTNSGLTEVEKQWTGLETKWHRYPKIYMSLSKWYLTLFVAMTADAGFCLAPLEFDHKLFVFATVGTVLCSCAANTFNQIAEVPYDAQMDRTKRRPLVRSIISPLHATVFGISSAIAGVSCLYYGVNGLTAALGFANIILYAGVYTPLKRRHWSNTWVGSIVGAVPPIMGWTAATGTLDMGALILAGILYSWQFPHFFALAWRRKGDYARGSYHMLPLSHPEATKSVVVGHSLALCALSVAAPFSGVTSWAFIGMAAPFNAWLMHDSIKFYRKGNSSSALKLYKCSLYYILAVSLGLVIDRKVLMKDKNNSNEVAMSSS